MNDGKVSPDELEKKLAQAKHRLEEAEMRDRAKERKQRTRRLIERFGANGLENSSPGAYRMGSTNIEQRTLDGYCSKRGAILEKAIPGSGQMTNEELQHYLYEHLMHS